MRNLLVLLALILSLQFGVTSYAQDSGCDEVGPPAAGLCKAYCEVLECDINDSNGCYHLLITYINLTGYGPPCDPICSPQDIEECDGQVSFCDSGDIICTRGYDPSEELCFFTTCL